MSIYRYTAYGLHIQSHLPLQELLPGNGNSVDVHINYGTIPAVLPQPSATGIAWQSAPGQLLLDVHGVARYLVRAGQEIVIEPASESTEADVRTFLLGSALGALLHQRHILALHASAMQTKHGAVLFMGRSGSGKSTLLAALAQRGYAMLADDITGIITQDTAHPCVLPAFPYTRLWADVAARLHQPVQQLRRVRASLEKYCAPVNRFCTAPLPIYAVYVLTLHNRPDILLEPVEHLHRFAMLSRYTYRKKFVDGLGLRQSHFHAVVRVARTARVQYILRPMYPFLLDELVHRLEQEWN